MNSDFSIYDVEVDDEEAQEVHQHSAEIKTITDELFSVAVETKYFHIKIETQIRRLLQLNKEKLILKTEYKAIRPTGSQRPRMYGLPKTHKKDVPLRPILSMTGSAKHELAKWLTCLLQPGPSSQKLRLVDRPN